LLPEVNNTVLARITRLTPRVATCSILAIYPSSSKTKSTADALTLPAPPTDVAPVAVPAQSQFSGQIRAQDVRATEKDKVVIGDVFRVGDVVRAAVISLGDQRDYYLSTAGNEYGVLLAWSANESGAPGGELMEPISWQEMRDPVTGRKETRKVAKPV
jgi:exosome complex component CSL4